MYINILQLPDEHPDCFMGWEWTEEHGGVKIEDYELVYEGEVDDKDLEEIYRHFNLECPIWAPMRNMSVSDLIFVDNGKGWDRWFVDNVGFRKVEVAAGE